MEKIRLQPVFCADNEGVSINIDSRTLCGWRNSISEKEVNGKKYVSFILLGASRKDIKYETEFINKTKEMYVNITGEYKNDTYGVEDKLKVHYLVDTEIYDAFKVVVNHGFVTLVLYEKKNEQPALKDLGKREKRPDDHVEIESEVEKEEFFK